MPNFRPHWLVAVIALSTTFSHAATADEMVIADPKSQPESLTMTPGGVLIVGSASTPFVYKVRPGSTASFWCSARSPTPRR